MGGNYIFNLGNSNIDLGMLGYDFRSIIILITAPLNAGFENYFLADVIHGAKEVFAHILPLNTMYISGH